MVKKQRAKPVAGQDGASPSPVLRPCKDVIERILWDPALDVSDFTFGYTDRFSGVKEAPCSAPNTNVKGQARMLIKVQLCFVLGVLAVRDHPSS
jgi:uncharacterized protein (UPF0248 family)